MATKSKWYEVKAMGDGHEVRIFGEIGWDTTAQSFVDVLDTLGDGQLNVRINSIGGSVGDGLTIYNRLVAHKGGVHVIIEGFAFSMGSVIAMAGDVVEAFPASMMMIHDPAMGAFGNSADFRKNADMLDQTRDLLLGAYERKTGLARDQIQEWMSAETFFTAEEALAAGLIDGLLEDETLDMAACARDVDLTQFKNLPESIRSLVNAGTPAQPAAVAATTKDVDTMPTDTKAAEKATVTDNAAVVAAAKAEALAAERSRITDLRAMFQPHDQAELLATCEADGTEPDAAGKLLLTALGKGVEPTQRVTVIQDARAKQREGLVAALTHRVGIAKDDTRNEYRSSSLFDIARMCAVNAGHDVRGKDKMQIINLAFSHSGDDFDGLFENVLGKVLMNSYGSFESTWRAWADVGSVSDFKVNSRLKMGTFSSLDTIPESGEYKAGTFSEEKETIQAATKGKMLTLNRQMIINDDLNSLSRLTGMLGQAAARTLEADVYAVLTGNGNMVDGTAMFHADHSNLAGSGGALAVATLSAGKAALRKQTFGTAATEYLDIRPANLLVPVAIEDVARTLIASETDPASSNSRKPNIHRNSLNVISSPYLDSDSATAWYLLGAANQYPTIEVAFLDGMEAPYMESQQGFTTDGVSWKVRMDYGTASVDYRAAYKNAGA